MSEVDGGWVLRSPGGHLVASTFSTVRRDAWGKAFDFLCDVQGDAWRERFWKKLEPSKAWARRHGWIIVRAKIVEAP